MPYTLQSLDVEQHDVTFSSDCEKSRRQRLNFAHFVTELEFFRGARWSRLGASIRTMSAPHDEDEQPSILSEEPRLPDRGIYDGPTRAAPYGLTRLAPAYSLMDVAAEIERADAQLATVTTGKLSLIFRPDLGTMREEAKL